MPVEKVSISIGPMIYRDIHCSLSHTIRLDISIQVGTEAQRGKGTEAQRKMKTYRDLQVWQKSMTLVTEVYKIS